jgi:hypothetical protein
VYFTLPSGQEEVMVDYEMCFVDKVSFMNNKENGINLANKFESSLKNNNRGPDHPEDLNLIDPEFQLSHLINYIKKQGYPVENSFVSFFSADF